MKIDLAAIADAITKAPRGAVRLLWEGGAFEIDELAFIGRLADALATIMGQNLFRGLTPDGTAAMPGRMKDGRPRGQGSAIARALAAIQTAPLEWTIAAHREIPGHLARIMRDVVLRAPALDTIPPVVLSRAFERSVKTSELGRGLRGGGRLSLGRAAKFGATGAERPQAFGRMGGAKNRDTWKGLGSIGWAVKPRRTRITPLGRSVRSGGTR